MKLSHNKLKRQKGPPNDKTVLFVCVENAGRSQMAEGFFRRYTPRGYMTLSAGTKPSGANSPNYAFPLPLIFGIEILASALLMVVILVVVYTSGLRGFSGIIIGGIVGLDIFFLAFISGASMNPVRSLAPAVLAGIITNLWLYWTASFVGTSTVAFFLKKFIQKKKRCQGRDDVRIK